MSRSGLLHGVWMCLGRVFARSIGSIRMTVIAALSLGLLHSLTPPAYAERQASGPIPGERLDQASLSLRMQRLQALIPDWQRRCVDIEGGTAVTWEQRALQQAIADLRESDLGNWLAGQASDRSVLVCLDSRTELEAYYRAHLHLIGLSARLNSAGRLVFLAHELAHVPQHPRFSNNRHFSPQDMLLLHRVREATAEAVATRVLWQLRGLGIDAPWQAKLATAYGDIADHFEVSMGRMRGRFAELSATRSAFHHWFEADWRPDVYDELMFKTLARIAGDHIGILPPSRRLSDGYIRAMSDYAGQQFLIEGDGRTQLEAFGIGWSASGSQARLDAILDRVRLGKAAPVKKSPTTEGGGLSASSSGPMRLNPTR